MVCWGFGGKGRNVMDGRNIYSRGLLALEMDTIRNIYMNRKTIYQ